MFLLVAIVGAGAFVRLTGLGETNFRHDEVMVYHAAQSLQRGEGPRLLSGQLYDRGIDVTRMIALVDPHLSDPELAARLPSATFGVLGLALFALVAWSIAGPWAAVWATLLLAVFPEAVSQSRQVRFYTYQLLYGIFALFAAWQAVRQPAVATLSAGADTARRWAWAALATLAFLLAARVQVVTLSVFLGWALSLAIFALVDLRRLQRGALTRSVPLQLTLLGLLGACLVLLLARERLGPLLEQATAVAAWAGDGGSPLTYYWAIAAAFPLLVSLAPLVFLGTALRSVRLAVFLACWAGVPLFLHSFVLPWKGERFVLLAMPALFLAAGVAAALACSALYRFAQARLPKARFPGPRTHRLAAASLVAVVAVAAVITTPAFNWARRVAFSEPEAPLLRERWDRAGTIVRELDPEGRIPVGSSDALAAHFYWSRLDFTITDYERVAEGSDPRAQPVREVVYSNAPILSTPDLIRRAFAGQRWVLIAADSSRWDEHATRAELRRVLEREAEELCRGRCGSVRLFRWSPAGAGNQ